MTSVTACSCTTTANPAAAHRCVATLPADQRPSCWRALLLGAPPLAA